VLGNLLTMTVGDDEVPASVPVVNVGGPVTQLGGGSSHVCALLTTGAVRCWGFGFRGALGYGNTDDIGDDEDPASAGNVDLGGPAVQLASGSHHNCALLASGSVRCWGANFYGALGYGDTEDVGDDEVPAAAGDVNVGGPVARLVAGFYFTCALLTNGGVRCWGLADSGQLGQANTENIGDDEDAASVDEVNVGGPVSRLAAGVRHVCALLENGALRCWGEGMFGALGYGNTSNVGDDEEPAVAGDVLVF
jgi:alpha-tubulin suppressor-like RCC1 family protein